ncbi:FMN-binding negative transcriptional regulator [Aliikangiella sp. IMCC44632]
MYIPSSFKIESAEVIQGLIKDNAFATLFSASLEATHLPFVLQANEGKLGSLYAHMARANPHWKQLDGEKVLVVFQGPHSYISPSFYAKSPAVPTWNYVAVHCIGQVTLINDNDNKTAMDKLVEAYEPTLLANNNLMPSEYTQKLRQAVVGFKIVIDTIQAKEKLGQQRSKADQLGVYKALQQSQRLEDQLLYRYMKKRGVGTGD